MLSMILGFRCAFRSLRSHLLVATTNQQLIYNQTTPNNVGATPKLCRITLFGVVGGFFVYLLINAQRSAAERKQIGVVPTTNKLFCCSVCWLFVGCLVLICCRTTPKLCRITLLIIVGGEADNKAHLLVVWLFPLRGKAQRSGKVLFPSH